MIDEVVIVSRRAVLAGSGALLFGFCANSSLFAQQQSPPLPPTKPNSPPLAKGATNPPPAPLPGSLKTTPFLDSWIHIDADGAITVFTGKAELGQGSRTALLQIAAEQLDADLSQIKLVTADTALTPNEGFTAGSNTMQQSGTAIMNAAAQVRQILIQEAAQRAGVQAQQMRTEKAVVVAPDGRRFDYGQLVSAEMLHLQAVPQSSLKEPNSYRVMNHSVQRVDIPAKMTGGAAFVQDLRLPDMVHGRIVRPPSYGAQLTSVDTSAMEKMPGVLKVVRDGNFLAVIAQREFQSIAAMRSLAAAARWQETAKMPNADDLPAWLMGQPAQDLTVLDQRRSPGAAAKSLTATYTRPFLSHGSIGPSCAVAQMDNGMLTVWTHTQGVFPDRAAIAEMLHMPPEQVRCIQTEGSGCYGHNGADDAAADAALLARTLPGRPVRVQWMREQEHAWEPFGPAMMVKVRASLDGGGGISDWDYAVWSNTHSTRPGPAGSLLAARDLANPFPQPPPKDVPMPAGGGDRNSIPLYKLPSARVIYHFLAAMPVRVSALRSLGGYINVFAIESFMDELAAAAAADPVEFRLKYLDDPRARDVISTAARHFGWSDRAKAKGAVAPGRGYGFAFARYENRGAYCAIACEVEIERETGSARMLRAVAAVDSGQVVSPDGLANQIEGAILQSMSWTLYEHVTFDSRRITSIDWSTYPILRFSGVPDAVEVRIINRPGKPFLGSGEAGQGPTAAALANAIADATGHRLRDLPLTRQRIKAAIGA